MTVKNHIYIGTAAAAPLSVISPSGSLLFLCVSLLVDIDHFLFFTWHQKKIILNPKSFIRTHEDWDYFGPRIHLFHNYETILIAILSAFVNGDIWLYFAGGIVFHLICDQVSTFHKYRFLRIRSLIGDFIRYRQYLCATRKGQEKKFIVAWRNTWINHIINAFPEKSPSQISTECAIMKTYPDKPFIASDDFGTWRSVF